MTDRANIWTWDVVIHTTAGLVALVAGGLMFNYAPAWWVFCVLMLLSALSAFWISWRHNAWVAGHWLAMLPILGVGWVLLGDSRGFIAAYVLLWIAFGHFLYRGLQSTRKGRQK